jgi:predicted dehydrogenase
MSPHEIAFVGGALNSAIGNVHRIASQMDGRFSLVGGCFSRNPQTNAETAENWGIGAGRIYADVHELIDAEQGRLDAVAVLTPVFSHAPIITALIEKGFNVISEKPLVSDFDEADRLQSALQRTGGRLLVTFNYTGYPMIRELRERISRGDFGVIKHIRLTMQQESFVKRDAQGNNISPQSWRLEDRTIPTVSLDLGMHVVHLQQFLVPGAPSSVFSRMDSFGAFDEVVDDVDIMYRCDGGLYVHGWWSKSAAGHANGLSVEVFGSEGSARWVQMEPELLKLRNTTGVESAIHRGTVGCMVASQPRYNRFKAGHPDGFIEAFANTYNDIATEFFKVDEDDRKATVVAEFSIHQSKLLLGLLQGAVESARTRSEVRLSL